MAKTPPPPSSKKAGPPTAKPKPVPYVPKPPSGGSGGKARTPKTFAAAPLCGDGEGEKALIYGKSGIGKTTLAAQIPNSIFIPLDDGARKVHNPITGEKVTGLDQTVEDFDDLRDVARQIDSLIPVGGAMIIDTITRAQAFAEQWVVENVPLEKGGKAKNIEHFGFGKGYRHVLDAMRTLMSDLDKVIRSGRHVILLGQLDQSIVANPAGADYYAEVPKLTENKQGPIRTEVCEWCDHVFRVGYLDVDVVKDDVKARAGKARGDTERAVFTGGAQHYIAKTRPIKGYRIPPVIGFNAPEDNSLWQFVLEGAQIAAE